MTEERKRAIERELKRLTTSLGRIAEEVGYSVSIYAHGSDHKNVSTFQYEGCVTRGYGQIDGILDATKEEAWEYKPEEEKEELRKKYGKEGEEE